ncbi:14194_t:CDS:2, partial [Acaulospora colombiana]
MLPYIGDLPEVKSFIGVIFAVTGNILISVALNIQKNAHNELRKLHQLDQLDYEAYIGNRLYSSESNTHNLDTTDTEGYEVLLDPEQYSEKNYLHSKSWWAGILLMIVGELGNFIAYAFAPASVVAPLGTVALISNVILAPIMLKETFRTQDLAGILIAIIGAVLVVLTSKSEEVKLSPGAIWAAIKQPQFTIYLFITCALAVSLLYLSDRIGHKLIIIDLSLVAIFATDRIDSEAPDRRLSVRPRHLDNAKKAKQSGFVLTGGAILSDHSNEGRMIGSVMVFEAESEEQVRKAVEQDPYVIENVWESYEIIPFK